MKFKVFISSVQSEFAKERVRLVDYIRKDVLLGAFFNPFIFEEIEACDNLPKQVYLGEVRDCDIYLGLLGSRFGYEVEPGVSATECEYDLATQLGKTRLVFFKEVERREPKERRFVDKVQNSLVRKSFSDFETLRLAVYGALVRFLEQSGYVRLTPFDAAFDTGLTIADIDLDKVSYFLDKARAAKKLTVPTDADAKWILNKLDAIAPDGRISNAAVLLFAKDPQRKFISSEVKCLQYWGNEVERPIPSYRFYQGGLVQMIESALAFVMSRIDHEVHEPASDGVAKGSDELPELAVREAIVNAVCHRDYSDNGSVQVMIFRNRLEIINPGTLPKGWTVERLLQTHDSKSRNLVIAQALNWAGYVEKSGNGTESIVRRCIESGLQSPEYHPDNTDFKVIIWRKAQSGPSRGPVGAQSGHSQAQSGTVGLSYVTPRERCLLLLSKRELRRNEIAASLGIPNKSGRLNRMLRDLVIDGLIERTIPDKPNSSQQRYRITEKATGMLGFIDIIGQGK